MIVKSFGLTEEDPLGCCPPTEQLSGSFVFGDFMIYGSLCSGIDEATILCNRCGKKKGKSYFHKSSKRPSGFQSWCKTCHNEYQRKTRKRREPAEVKRNQNYKAKYGIASSEVDNIFIEQTGKCALCGKELIKFCVDHDHFTGKVRGLLCYRCNIIIGGLDDPDFRSKAVAYIGMHQ